MFEVIEDPDHVCAIAGLAAGHVVKSAVKARGSNGAVARSDEERR